MDHSERDDLLHNLVYAYCRWKWLMLATAAVLFAMVMFIAFLMTPTWTAEVHMIAESTLPPPAGKFADPTRAERQIVPGMYGEHVSRILQGKQMARAVVREFGLAERKRLKSEAPSTARERVLVTIFDTLFGGVEAIQGLLSKDKDETPIDWEDRAIEDFQEGLFAWVSSKLVAETDIIELTVNGETPELANDITEFMIAELRRELADMSQQAGTAAIVAFEEQLTEVAKADTAAQKALEAFLEARHGVAPSDDIKLKAAELARLQMELARMVAERNVLREALARGPKDGTTGLAQSARIQESEVIRQLATELHEQRVKQAALLRELTDIHPDVLTLGTEIEQTKKQILLEVQNIAETLDSEISSKTGAMEAISVELSALPAIASKYAELQAEADTTRRLRGDLSTHIDEMRVRTAANIPAVGIKVINRSPASTTGKADVPSWPIAIVVGMVFAAGAAVVLPPFIEYWRDPIRGELDITNRGIAALDVVPDFKAKTSRPKPHVTVTGDA